MQDILVSENFAEAEQIVPDQPTVDNRSARERDMADLLNHPGYVALAEDIRKRVADYRALRFTDLKDKSLEQVGQSFIVSSTVADELEGILSLVERLHDPEASTE